MLEELKAYTRWFGGWVLFAILFQVAFAQTPFGRDDSDEQGWFGKRSGAEIVTDARTGCQYFKSGGITPRLDVTGKQIGCR